MPRRHVSDRTDYLYEYINLVLKLGKKLFLTNCVGILDTDAKIRTSTCILYLSQSACATVTKYHRLDILVTFVYL
jgi:hypothetical protein